MGANNGTEDHGVVSHRSAATWGDPFDSGYQPENRSFITRRGIVLSIHGSYSGHGRIPFDTPHAIQMHVHHPTWDFSGRKLQPIPLLEPIDG